MFPPRCLIVFSLTLQPFPPSSLSYTRPLPLTSVEITGCPELESLGFRVCVCNRIVTSLPYNQMPNSEKNNQVPTCLSRATGERGTIQAQM